jgi:hypothetical protein
MSEYTTECYCAQPTIQVCKRFPQHIRRNFDAAIGRFGASLDGEVDITTGYVKFVPTRCQVMLLDGDTY